MNKIVIKKCFHHGELKPEDVIKSGFRKGQQCYKCKKCMKESHRRNYLKCKEEILRKCADYKKKHPEKRKEWRKNEVRKKRNPIPDDQAYRWPIPKDCSNRKKYIQAQRKMIYALWDFEKLLKKYKDMGGKE